MRAIVTIQSGTHAGRKLWLKTGQSMRVGRTELADFAVPDDARMSSIHFELDCGPQAVRLRDLNSANGTTVNGRGVAEASLRDGDEIVAGSTTFRVSLEDSLRQSVPVSPPVRSTSSPRAHETLTGSLPRSFPSRERGDLPEAAAARAAPAPVSDWQLMMPGQNRQVVVGPMEHVTVGRAPTADICVPDDLRMSGLHFGLSASGAGLRIEDLSSTNGTFVNGQRIQATALSDGDVIVAGSTQLVVRAPRAGHAAEPPAETAPAAPVDLRGTVACPESERNARPAAASLPEEPELAPVREDVEPSTQEAIAGADVAVDQVQPSCKEVPRADQGPRGEIEIVILDVRRAGRPEKKLWLTPDQQIVVGAAAGCDEIIENGSGLAARHFLLQVNHADCVVRDLETPGGTYVNERKTGTATLQDGDMLRAGDCTFHVQIVYVAK